MTDTSDKNQIYPFEIVVPGTPRSLQNSNTKARWIETVRAAGQARADKMNELGFLYACPVALTIYYFPDAPMVGDVDNIVKPIQDALVDVAYCDDRNVERVIAQKFEPDPQPPEFPWSFDDPSEQLAEALEAHPPVVYIRVDDDLGWRTVR